VIDVVRDGRARRGRGIARLLHGGGRIPGARLFTRIHARLYRASRGKVISHWFGAPVLVLETIGRHSGRPRTVAIQYLMVDGDYVVTAANAGSDRTPAWWLNLRDAGVGIVHIKGRRQQVTPRLATGVERDELWAKITAAYPSVGHYRRYTSRAFPVVVLQVESEAPAQ
jgi:deazaflavin-dependent oxidoreductase (nitroreductase family)